MFMFDYVFQLEYSSYITKTEEEYNMQYQCLLCFINKQIIALIKPFRLLKEASGREILDVDKAPNCKHEYGNKVSNC